jgi:tRNA-Thr(GGU) m(6)t(6)A37 methyltransferase TsaA
LHDHDEENRFPGPTLRVIGSILTPFLEAKGTPIQPAYARKALGRVLVDEDFAPALLDLEGFERVWLLYWMDRVCDFRPRVVPYRDTREHGLFATRSPCRPNPIGLSVVRLLGREGNVLHVEGVDMLDGTPLLDLKPYVPEFDAYPGSRAGWFDDRRADREAADERFHEGARPGRGGSK